EELKLKNRDGFIFNFTQGTQEAMMALLQHGQHWKGVLKTGGANQTLIDEFRFRKRLLRQVSMGVDPKDAGKRAGKPEEYRKWALTSEFGLTEDEADKLLIKGIDAYKQFKLTGKTV